MDRAAEPLVAPVPVRVDAGRVVLDGDLAVPDGALAVVLFAHGSGSGRLSPRNRQVASALNRVRLATLLIDLLTAEEGAVDADAGHLRFDIEFLAERLGGATDWLAGQAATDGLPLGYFGASTGAAAALVAAADRPAVGAIVSRGGRPDLAGPALARVVAPTLLIVGELDVPVIALNREAMARMTAMTAFEIVPGASHLFEERGALERVAGLAGDWFVRWLSAG